MTDQPARIDRPITDDERTLIKQLCIAAVANQTGVSEEAAADALDDLIEKHGMYMEGDTQNVYVRTGTPGDGKNHVLVHVTREWLSFYASHPDEPINLDDHLTMRRTRDLTDEANQLRNDDPGEAR